MKDERQRLIRVPVKTLEAGIQSHGRIFDLRGRLLLSEGATLTEEMKASLIKRGVGAVLRAPIAKADSDDVGEAAAAKRVIDQLDRKSAGGGRSRRRLRRRFRSHFAIRMINVEPATTHRIWATNISEQGLGFVHRGEIKGNRFIVQFGNAALEAEIVRRRLASEGFWEYGATFSARLDQRRSGRQHAVRGTCFVFPPESFAFRKSASIRSFASGLSVFPSGQLDHQHTTGQSSFSKRSRFARRFRVEGSG